MANKPPAYQMYAADFETDTAGWSNEEVGAYVRLLNYGWINRGIPNDTWRLARIARESIEHFEGKLWPTISTKFEQNGTGEKLLNPRQELERTKQDEYRRGQSEAGKRGVEAKKQKGLYPFNQPTLEIKIKQPLKKKSSEPASNLSSENQALRLQSSSSSSTTTSKKKKDSREPQSAPDLHPSKRIILNYETGKLEGIKEGDKEYLRETYPACDLDYELREFASYWYARPKQRKSNWWKTLCNRLAFVQEKGGTKHGAAENKRTYDPLEKGLRDAETRLRGDDDRGPDKGSDAA